MQKCIVAGDKVRKDKDVLVSNEELESVIENLAEAYRKKSGIIIEVTALSFKLKCKSNFKVNLFLVSFSFAGNSERPASRRQVDGITKQVGREVCTKTIYYLSRFDRTKDAWDKDANTMGGNQDVKMPRRAVGTMEMIKMASALRKAEIAGLKKNIDRLKEEILALEAADNLKK